MSLPWIDPKVLFSTLRKSVNENVHLVYIREMYMQGNNTVRLDKRSQIILSSGENVRRYEAWIWCVLRLFQGRGKMGSKVGAFREYQFSGSIKRQK